MGPLISVITITYNAAKELPATIKSVKEQTFTDFEHLIIDGNSTDNTLKIAKEEEVGNMKIISEPDKGLYDAMNKGIKAATGKYLIFLNAGDSFHSKETLKDYAQAASKSPDIIYGDTVIVDKDRNILRPRHLSVPESLTVDSFKNGMLICHQAFMVRKEIAPLYDLSYRFSADYDWTIRCIKNSSSQKNINLKMIAVDYLSDGLTDKNHLKSLQERFRIMCIHYGFLPTFFRHIRFIGRDMKRKLNHFTVKS